MTKFLKWATASTSDWRRRWWPVANRNNGDRIDNKELMKVYGKLLDEEYVNQKLIESLSLMERVSRGSPKQRAWQRTMEIYKWGERMTRFILGRSFQANENGFTEKVERVTRSRIDMVPTRYGEVFAYVTEIDNSSKPNLFTLCPGFFNKKLEKENGYEALDLLEVPEEKQLGVKEDLEKIGYMGEFRW
jgi:hypothetical protein